MSNSKDWKWTTEDGISYPVFGTTCPDCGGEGTLIGPSYGSEPPIFGCYAHGGRRDWHARTAEARRASQASLAESRANAQKYAK